MCCWILQGRLLRKNDFEPVYSQTLFHICTQNPPLPRTKPPPRLIYVVKMFNAKKRPKCSVVRCKAVHCRQHPLVGTQTNICRNQEQISREIKNRFLEKSRKDFWRNQEQISGEIQKRFLQKFEEKVFAPRSQLHVSPTTSALSTKCLFGINCLTLTLFLLMEVLLGAVHTWRHQFWGVVFTLPVGPFSLLTIHLGPAGQRLPRAELKQILNKLGNFNKIKMIENSIEIKNTCPKLSSANLSLEKELKVSFICLKFWVL